MPKLSTILTNFGYNQTEQQISFIKLLVYRGALSKSSFSLEIIEKVDVAQIKEKELIDRIAPIWKQIEPSEDLLKYQNTLISNDQAKSILESINFESFKDGINFLEGVTQLKFLRSTFHIEGRYIRSDSSESKEPIHDPSVNLKRWNTDDNKEIDNSEIIGIAKSLGLIDEVSWPQNKEVKHVLVHGGLDKHVKLRVDFIKPFSGNLYYLSYPRGLFNDEEALAPILAEWLNATDKIAIIKEALSRNADMKTSNKHWKGDLTGLKADILNALGIEEWPKDIGWYYFNPEIHELGSKHESRESLLGWPTAMDMFEYHFNQHASQNKEAYQNIKLLPVLATGPGGRIANTSDTVKVFEQQYGAHIHSSKDNKEVLVFISDNTSLSIGYQDAIVKSKGTLPTDKYEVNTVGPAAIEFSLGMATDQIAKTIYTKKAALLGYADLMSDPEEIRNIDIVSDTIIEAHTDLKSEELKLAGGEQGEQEQ